MLYFLYGEDEVRVASRRRELLDGFRRKYPTGEVQIFDFEDSGTPETIRSACSACDQGLFAIPKLIVWLHPFVLKEGEDVLKKFLMRFLKESPSDISLLILASGKIKKTHPVAALLLKKSDRIEEMEPLRGVQLERYIASSLRVFDADLSISRTALGILVKAVGSRGERRSKHFFSSRREQAGESKHEAVYGLLSMRVAVAPAHSDAEVFDRGIRDASGIARETKLPPFVVQNALRSFENLPLSRLTAGLMLLADMDAAMKIGELDPGGALDAFVWKF
jgi:DNA polymerase III delta subunit